MSRKSYRALVAGLAVLAAPLAHAEEALLPHERYSLPNGMQVILAPQEGASMVAVDLWYRVGSAQDPARRGGLAHVAEHLMFNGSEHVPIAHSMLVHRYGGSAANAYTTLDHTAYYQVMPSYNLEAALWLESDRMGFLEPVVDAGRLGRERNIIKSELRLRKRFEVLDADLRERLFPPSHPYAHPIGGTSKSLDNIGLADLQAFHNYWYAPANATLALVGGFDPLKARQLIEKYFGGLAATPAPEIAAPTRPTVKKAHHRIIDARSSAAGPALAVGWLVPGAYQDGEAELEVLARILEKRLVERLVWNEELARQVDVLHVPAQGVSMLQLRIEGLPGTEAKAHLKAAHEVLAALASEGPLPREIERTLRRIDTATVRELDGLSGLLTKAERLQAYNHYLGTPDRLAWDMNRYRAVTPDGLAAAAERWLGEESRIVVVREPKTAAIAEGGER